MTQNDACRKTLKQFSWRTIYAMLVVMTTQLPFSPITTPERLATAIEHVASQSLSLGHTILGRQFAIDTICFFAHSAEEYDFLQAAVKSRGNPSPLSHGPTLYVETDFKVAGQRIQLFGVRRPDPTRPWIGYGDYPLNEAEYAAVRDAHNPFIREITSGAGKALLQFEHPDFDVLGFGVRKEDH